MSDLLPPGVDGQTVALTDIEVELPVGIAAWERAGGKTQKVVIDVELAAPMRRFAGTRIEDCFDYDRIYRHVTGEMPARGHTDLLETLAEDLATFCMEDARVAACRVRLRKPHVYNGRAVPSVTFTRRRE